MVDQLAASPTKITVPPSAKTSEKAADKTAGKSGGFGFHDILSALNPLQYIPVVGTVYRSATGDTIPENTRMIGSMVVSFLTGGPIGVATSAAADVIEKATGVDPEKIGHNLLAKLGIGHTDDDSAVMLAKAASKNTAATTPQAIADASIVDKALASKPAQVETAALSPRQLAAYGVQNADNGEIKMGELTGSDVLNTIELHQLAMQSQGDVAASAYSAVMRPNEAGQQHSRTA